MLLDNQYEYIGIGSAYHRLHGVITVILLAEHLTELGSSASLKPDVRVKYE